MFVMPMLRWLKAKLRPAPQQPQRQPPAPNLAPRRDCAACGARLRPAPMPELPPVILDCDKCGTGWTWPPPERDAEGEGIWIAMYGASRLRRRKTWLREARLRLDWMAEHIREGSVVLEVGSGTGEFVKVAADARYEAYGVEPSSWAADKARDLGARVATGFVPDWVAEHPGVRPDAVALWHTIEHVAEPATLLRQVHEVLEPGALVFLEVPNYRSTEAKRLGVEWDGAQPDEHYYQFTPDGLEELLERSGYSDIEITPMTQEVYTPEVRWRAQRREAATDGRPWPPEELLRAFAKAKVHLNQ